MISITDPQTITVKVTVLGNTNEVVVPADTTPARLREIVAELNNPDLQLRYGGRPLSDQEEQETPLQNGDTVVASPPAVKHG